MSPVMAQLVAILRQVQIRLFTTGGSFTNTSTGTSPAATYTRTFWKWKRITNWRQNNPVSATYFNGQVIRLH